MYFSLFPTLAFLALAVLLPEPALSKRLVKKAICTKDALGQAFDVPAWSAEGDRFCSRWLSIGVATQTVATVTPVTTTVTTVTSIYRVIERFRDTTTETFLSTITVSPDLVKRDEDEDDLDAAVSKWIQRGKSVEQGYSAALVPRNLSPADSSAISSVCTCRRISSSVLPVTATADAVTAVITAVDQQDTTTTRVRRRTRSTTIFTVTNAPIPSAPIPSSSFTFINGSTISVGPTGLGTGTSLATSTGGNLTTEISTITSTTSSGNVTVTSSVGSTQDPTSLVSSILFNSSIISGISGTGSPTLLNVSVTVPITSNTNSTLLPAPTAGNLSTTLNDSIIPVTVSEPSSVVAATTNSSLVLPTPTTNGNLSASFNVTTPLSLVTAAPTSIFTSLANSSIVPPVLNVSSAESSDLTTAPLPPATSTTRLSDTTLPLTNATEGSTAFGSGTAGSRTGTATLPTSTALSSVISTDVTALTLAPTSLFPSNSSGLLVSPSTALDSTLEYSSLPTLTALTLAPSSLLSSNSSGLAISQSSTLDSASESSVPSTVASSGSVAGLSFQTSSVSTFTLVPTVFSAAESIANATSIPSASTSVSPTSTSSPGCSRIAPVENSGFETLNGPLSPPWRAAANSTAIQFQNDADTPDSPARSGNRHGRVISTSNDAVLTLNQSLVLCPNVEYDFQAWTRIPQSASGCTVVVNIGDSLVGLVSSENVLPVYQPIIGRFGPTNLTDFELVFTMTCSNAVDDIGVTVIDIDDVTLTARSL